MPTQKLTAEIITAAIEGFESQQRRIDTQIAELRAMLPGGPAETAATPEAPIRKRRVSAAARRKMALAQKARWAKIRGESEPTQAAAPPTKPKRKLSAAAKAKLVANLKRARAAKAAKAKPAVAKKAVVKMAAPKKVAAKKTAPAAAQGATETAGQ